MGPGYVLLFVCAAVFLYLFSFILVELLIQPNHKFHRGIKPDVPIYYQYYPPPPPEYYIRLEILGSQPEKNEVYVSNGMDNFHRN